MEQQANGTGEREFNRVEAAAFLTELGRKITPQRLATRAADGKGPPFEKNGRRVTYREAELRAWISSPEGVHKGGRGKRAPRDVRPQTFGSGIDLRTVLSEHVELAEKFADGTADAVIGFRFARSLATLRRLVR